MPSLRDLFLFLRLPRTYVLTYAAAPRLERFVFCGVVIFCNIIILQR